MRTIIYGFYHTQFGEMVLAHTSKGLCWLGFMVEGYKGNGYERMRKRFSLYNLVHDDDAIKTLGDRVMAAWCDGAEKDFDLDLQGTDFQKTVWLNLLGIRKGQVCSYGDIANDIGNPRASRAVGSAVGENPVSLIVPCHRVLRKAGGVGNYGWGADLKRQILAAEGVCV